jgi:hypothetical protein
MIANQLGLDAAAADVVATDGRIRRLDPYGALGEIDPRPPALVPEEPVAG